MHTLLAQSQLNIQNQGIKGRDRLSNQRDLGWTDLHMFNRCHPLLKWTTWKTRFRYKLCIRIYVEYLQVESNSIKMWSIYWVMSFKHWKHLSTCEDHMHIRLLWDYREVDRCDSFNGATINFCLCDKLLILGYRYAQEEDSKVGELIYLLWRVVLMKFMPNEQISTGNTKEIHKSSKNC